MKGFIFQLKSLNLIPVLFIVVILCLANIGHASTTVDPSRFLFVAKPGSRVTGTIKVTNPSVQTAEVSAIIYDWTLNDADRMMTSEVGTRKESLKGLIKFNPQNFKIPPGESQIVRFTLTAPKEGELFERRGIVFFEEKNIIQNPDGMGANLITQVGSTIYLAFEGMRMAFNLIDARVEKGSDGKCQGVIKIANQGAGHVRYRISYKLINEKNALINENQFSEKVILPQFERTISFPLPDRLAPGKYNLLLKLSFVGTNKSTSRTISFTVEN
jgi:P pilus assembly chaperone PapD